MTRSEETIWCDGCGAEIFWSPYRIEEIEFCCQNCAFGISCDCGDTLELEDEYRDTTSPLPTLPSWI